MKIPLAIKRGMLLSYANPCLVSSQSINKEVPNNWYDLQRIKIGSTAIVINEHNKTKNGFFMGNFIKIDLNTVYWLA